MKSPWAALVGAIALLTSTSVVAESLSDALVDAYLNNPELAAGRARLQATDELVPQALSGWRPRIFIDTGVEGVRGESKLQDATRSANTNRMTSSASLTINQNLYAGGATTAATSRAENLVRAERANLLALQQEILLEAVDAYTAVWRDRAVLDLALNNEQRLGRQLQATRDRFTVGDVARTDVAQAEARLSRARADVEQAKADLAASAANFRQVIGHDPGELERPEPVRALPSSLEEARALADSNPVIVRQNFALSAAQADVDVAFADLLPSVDLQAQLSAIDEPTAQLDYQRAASVGLNVSVPLYQGGAAYSRVRERRQEVRRQRDLLENTHRVVQEAVATAWDRLLAASAAIEAFRSEVRANEIALAGVQEEALVGARTVLDVLDAEQELFEAQVNLVRAAREEVVASYQLKSAVGELNVVSLDLDVEPYDDTFYYRQVVDRLAGVEVEFPRPKPKPER